MSPQSRKTIIVAKMIIVALWGALLLALCAARTPALAVLDMTVSGLKAAAPG